MNGLKTTLSFAIAVLLPLSSLHVESGVSLGETLSSHPQWAIRHGEEFWHQTGPARAAGTRPGSQSLVSSTPFDLSEIMERVSHAFRTQPGNPFPQVEAATYTAWMSEEGLELLPHRPFDESDGRAVLPRCPHEWFLLCTQRRHWMRFAP